MAKKTIDFRGRQLFPIIRISDSYITAYARRHARSLIRGGLWAELDPSEFRRVTSQEFSAAYNIDERFAP